VKLGERTAISVFKMTPGEEGEIELAVPDTKILERDLEYVRKSIPELRDKEKKLRLLLGAPGGSHVLRFLAEKPRLGVELLDVTADLREYFGGKKETGVLVGKVLTGSPAERAGLRAGDLIVAVDGEAVESSGDLIGIVAEKKAGSLDIDVIRDKKPLKLKATLPARDEDEEEGEPVGPRAALLPPS
jgi:membrane-associated protease RseP (regulator of RpoE activity)